jgi:PPOX class probable F420-dependent enzyme
MTADEVQAFLTGGPSHATFATSRHDGEPHAVPVNYVFVDGAIHFLTTSESVKGRNLARDPRAVFVVYDKRGFVQLRTTAEVSSDHDDIFATAIELGERYFGSGGGKQYAEQWAFPGALRVRLSLAASRIYAQTEIFD